MRTILIPLILICSLTQFVSAQGNKAPLVDDKCGTVFICFVPEVCVNDLVTTISTGKVSQILAATDVTVDCPAIVRYHLYTPNWAHVSIRSLQDINTITSIEFIQEDGSNNEKQKFSCILTKDAITLKDEMKGMYAGRVLSTNDEFEANAYLDCTFTVRTDRGPGNGVVELAGNNFVIIKTNQGSTIPLKNYQLPPYFSCDPSNLQLYLDDSEKDSRKVMYKKIKFSPGTVFCDDNYELEYRKTGGTKHDKITESDIVCNNPQYSINNIIIPTDEAVALRCASEAKYYCAYEPMPKQGESALEYTAPSWNPKTEAKLKCPNNQKILNIVKDNLEISLLDSYSIECEIYGSKQYWVVKEGSSTKKYKLTTEGPPVYCSATVKCELQHFKMSNSQVKNGFLDTNRLPKCGREDGKLLVGDKEVLNTGCNEQTGKYFYTLVDGNKEIIDDQTQFVCKFPPVENTKKNAENQKFVWTGVGVAGGIAVALVVVFIFGLYFCCRHLENRKRRQRAAAQAACNDRYNVNKNLRKDKAKVNAAAKNEELAQLQQQNALMQFIRRGKMKRLALEIEELERIYKGGNLPAAPLAAKEGNKWSPWLINRFLEARTHCTARLPKNTKPSRRPPFEHKATVDKNMKAIDKTSKSSGKYVEKQTAFAKDVNLRLVNKLYIGVQHKPQRLIDWKKNQKGE